MEFLQKVFDEHNNNKIFKKMCPKIYLFKIN